jgi:hypothetical protein
VKAQITQFYIEEKPKNILKLKLAGSLFPLEHQGLFFLAQLRHRAHGRCHERAVNRKTAQSRRWTKNNCANPAAGSFFPPATDQT